MSVNSFCVSRQTDAWNSSQLGLEPNSFRVGRRKDACELSWIGLEPNSFTVGRRTDACDSSWIGIDPNIFTVGWRTYVQESSRLGLESIDSFGHILCKEVLCLTVLGTRELTFWPIHCACGPLYLIYPPNKRLPLMMMCTIHPKNLYTHFRFGLEMAKILLVGFVNYPLGGPFTIILSIWVRMYWKFLPSPTLSEYQGCENLGCASRS